MKNELACPDTSIDKTRCIPGLLAAICAVTMGAACAEFDDPAASADELGTAVAELSYDAPRIQTQGTLQVAGSFFSGATEVRLIGGLCPFGTRRDSVQIWSDFTANSGAWWSWRWLSSVAEDCSAEIRLNVPAGGHWDNFHWRLYNRAYDIASVGTTASQSSTDWGGVAARAIDRNTNGNYWDGSVTHTAVEARPWWQVDLGLPRPIGTVIVYNRTDCCSERLADFDITTWDGSNWLPIGGITGPAQARNVFQTNVVGRYVRVQLRGTNVLSLAAVEVYVP